MEQATNRKEADRKCALMGEGRGKKKTSPHTHRLMFCYGKEGLKEKKGALFIYLLHIKQHRHH